MLDKIKTLGDQLSTKAADATEGLSNSIKSGVDELKNTVSNTATVVSEKAVRSSIEQLRNILTVAVDEFEKRPISEHPAMITATVNIGLVALQVQQVIAPESKEQALTLLQSPPQAL